MIVALWFLMCLMVLGSSGVMLFLIFRKEIKEKQSK